MRYSQIFFIQILPPQKSTAKGVKILKQFLYYARTGKIEISNNSPRRGFDSPFESDVYDEIEKMGYSVSSQVGSNGFSIDLAVEDPHRAGYYLLGIECDGASYHSSGWAKERDRARELILKESGWNIYRIWSTNWFESRKTEIEKLHKKIKELIRYPRDRVF